MADIPWGQIAGAGAQVVAGMAGNEKAAGYTAEELRMLREALAQYDSVGLPDSSPELLGPSAYSGIQADPATREAQMQALEELANVYRNGGMNLTDRANLAGIQSKTAQAERSARAGIADSMAARGISGGGSELAMNLAAQQGAAQRASTGGLEVAADAQKRALDAMLARGKMGGDIRGQDFSEKARAADAADSIARYNAASRTGAKQQGFNNSLTLAGAKAGAQHPLAGFYDNQAQDTRAEYAGYGAAAANAGRAIDSGRQETPQEREDRIKNGG